MKRRTFFDFRIMKTKCLDIQLSEAYTEPWQTSKMELFAGIFIQQLSTFKSFRKKRHFKCLTRP